VLAGIAAPFKWMALGYVRLAQAVSRQQEFAADALAARTVGAAHLIRGFEQLAGVSAATGAYIKGELLPMTKRGAAPPFFAGLTQFVDAHQAQLVEVDRDTLTTGEVDPFDSHPPLSARIEALRRLPDGPPALAPTGSDEPARHLLRHPEVVARSVLEFHAERTLQPIAWEATGELILRNYRDALRGFIAPLRTMQLEQLPFDDAALRRLLATDDDIAAVIDQLPTELVQQVAASWYTQALSIALADIGYAPETGPGKPLVMVRGDQRFEVAARVHDRMAGTLTQDAWLAELAPLELPEHPWVATKVR